MSSKMIFVNLTVADLAATTRFYEALGCVKNPQFSDEKAVSMVWSDTIFFMLLKKEFFATFTPKEIADARRTSEVLVALSFDSRAEVDAFAEAAAKAGGKAGLQIITIAEKRFADYRARPDFIQRYIFPGGMLLTKTAMAEQGRRVGLVLENVENFRLSYARTLRLWRERFLERWSELTKLGYDEEFRRKWVYYLSYCEAGFLEGTIDVGIYQYRKSS